MGGCPPGKRTETTLQEWWTSFFLLATCGFSWVASIPLLLISLGGCMQPHLGWFCGVVTGIAMFAVLVQVDTRIAAAVVFLVTLCSASLAGTTQSLLFAVMASGLTLLNALKRVSGPSPRVMEFQCQHFRGYHKAAELGGALDSIQKGKSFFACHPHGILSIGWITNVVWNRRFHHSAGRCFYLIDPTLKNKGLLARFFQDAFEGPHGGLRDTSKQSVQKLMSKGESVSMIPGAYQEATLFKNGSDRVAVSSRKGFIKVCLRHGYRLHPVYTFGESDTYLTLPGFEKFRLWLNKQGIPTVAFWGLSWCPLLPRRGCELMTFVGKPVEMPKIEEPTARDVDEWHAKYLEALNELFEKHKAEAGRPDAKLEIF